MFLNGVETGQTCSFRKTCFTSLSAGWSLWLLMWERTTGQARCSAHSPYSRKWSDFRLVSFFVRLKLFGTTSKKTERRQRVCCGVWLFGLRNCTVTCLYDVIQAPDKAFSCDLQSIFKVLLQFGRGMDHKQQHWRVFPKISILKTKWQLGNNNFI